MPAKRRQNAAETVGMILQRNGYTLEECTEIKMHFAIAMKVIIVIMMMRIVMKIMNNNSYLRIVATKQCHQFYKN